MWVRGLKPYPDTLVLNQDFVAPRVGAWIETRQGQKLLVSTQSHPVWVRGLKLNSICNGFFESLSHPVWVRGLKL